MLFDEITRHLEHVILVSNTLTDEDIADKDKMSWYKSQTAYTKLLYSKLENIILNGGSY